ncbi:MAG TPA: LysR family transcriptional regulator, partial [Pseudomonas sp.]|nr:LysR family transcriptional regulator [Pseudomonas sp.]
MDIDLARTFLEIIRGGSFIAAAERMHLTQTAVTARIQNLESQLGCRLFVRNRAGARLTDDGERFVAYANQLVQTWEAARRDLPLPQGYDQLLTLGAEVSLCNPLMLAWVQRLRETLPSHALRSEVASDEELQKKLDLGLLDAALVHQPEYWPGLQVEQLLEEKLIQVVQTRNPEP